MKRQKTEFLPKGYKMDIASDAIFPIELPPKGFMLFDEEGNEKEVAKIELTPTDVLLIMIFRGVDCPPHLTEEITKFLNSVLSRLKPQ